MPGATRAVHVSSKPTESGLTLSVRNSMRSVKSRTGVPAPAGRGSRFSSRTRDRTNEVEGSGGQRTTAPGSPSSGQAQRASCVRTRCSTKATWVLASSSSAKQKRSRPWAMKAAGGQPYTVTSLDGREVTSPITDPPRLSAARGVKSSTSVKGPGCLTPRAAQPAAASGRPANLLLGRSRWRRSSPLTEKTSARVCGARGPSMARPWGVSNSM